MPYKLAISSMSLGRCFAGHALSHKLDMAQKYGYSGIELFHEDLLDLASRIENPAAESSSAEPSEAAQLAAAHEIYRLCDARGLQIICLQPFMNYDGLLDRAEHEKHMRKLALWFDMTRALHTDIIQIPSNFLPADQVSDDLDLIAADLRKVADLGLQQSPPVRFVYESLCWGTRVDTWETCWEVVQKVDRPNFGICLDTFNIAGRIYADPASPTGCVPNAEEEVRRSIARLVSRVDVAKVFYVQVVDAERLAAPLVQGHPFYHPLQPARMSWSRNCRLFYGETDRGAYLPVREIAAAIFHGLGYEGWVSLELFNRRMSDPSPEVPEELAQRGAESWKKLKTDLGLDTLSRSSQRVFASL
ncbi:hypothetical protein VTK73DRAFT_10045 [Phialemonium thermophilum]|uniref:Xylose isomerase-like TIM barrel domain-containing protein n=1 Tax=Phialemonium thermophilum TaxID=223376 RepID=A0ABR3XI88_9PEZI